MTSGRVRGDHVTSFRVKGTSGRVRGDHVTSDRVRGIM